MYSIDKLAILVLLATISPLFSAVVNNDNLLAVVQVFRHGQRTPIDFYPTDPYADSSYWPVAPGQLVNEGKKQHYKLGQFTRKRYNGFLPSLYNSTLLYAQTTDIDRTHMSAQSNLAGLFPPTGSDIWNVDLPWQPIPVHPQDVNRLTQICDATSHLLSTVITNDTLFKELNEEYKDVYEYIRNHTGVSIDSVFGVYSIYDTLFIEDINGYVLPEWTQAVYPEPMYTLASYAMESFSYSDDLKRINAGLFFNDMVTYFDKMMSDSSSSYKYKMYSAHDANIAAFLNTIGEFTPHTPYFASTIYFELRKNKDKGYVNIWHKDQDNIEQITVKGCALNCTLPQFKTLIGNYLVNDTQYNNLCTVTTPAVVSPTVQENVQSFLNHRNPLWNKILKSIFPNV